MTPSSKTPRPKRRPFKFADTTVPPGERRLVELRLARRYTHNDVVIPVHVLHGKKPGPTLAVTAAVHGDEINGVEVIRRLLQRRSLQRLRGTLLAVPVVNVFGFVAHSRYLPDRRDLNRCFPGSSKGSLGARMAKLIMDEVLRRATHGIDLHTGSNHRANLPQIRADLSDPETLRLAQAFRPPVLIDSKLRDGSLREAAGERGVPLLLFEGGEALRFDEVTTRSALRGILNVLRALDMLPPVKPAKSTPTPDPFLAKSTYWIRAPDSGIVLVDLPLGATVSAHQRLGVVADPYGQVEIPIHAKGAGVVIGRTNLPLAHEGDALLHIAHGEALEDVADALEVLEGAPLADDVPLDDLNP